MLKLIKIIPAILFVFSLEYTTAQDLSLYKREVLVNGKDSLPYRILYPENYNPKKKYPLVVFLHGSGEAGNDNEIQLVHGSSLFLVDSIRKKYPAVVVFPQCLLSSWWGLYAATPDSLNIQPLTSAEQMVK